MNALLQMEDTFAVPEQEKERYKITDLNSLNWAFRKLAVIEQKKSEISAFAQAEIQRIKDWQEKELHGLEVDESFFRFLIEEYAMTQRRVDPKFKASTPYGKVSFRKQQAKWIYDEEKLVDSLKATGRTDLIRLKEEPDKDGLKKIAEVSNGQVIEPTTGAILEGVRVEEQGEVIKVEVSV